MIKRLLVVLLFVLVTVGFCSCKKEEQNPLFVEGSIVITPENMPIIAVTKANLNIAVNLTRAVLGCDEELAKTFLTVCATPDECYELLANGQCDIVIAHEHSKDAQQKFYDNGVSVLSQSIAKDALVFVQSEKNPTSNLEISQIKDIYNATITDWSTVGGLEGEIRAFMQKEGSAADTAFDKYIGADTTQLAVPTKTVQDKNDVYTARLEYDNGETAIGYALYYDTITPSADKNGNHILLSVGGVYPDGSTIQSGSYPLVVDIKVTINSDELSSSTVKLFYEWILSEQGIRIIGASGVILTTK